MSGIPSNLSRVPNSLAWQIGMRGINSTNVSLLNLTTQLTSTLRINKPSDDPIAASLIGVLDKQIEQGEQRERNLQHAASVMNTIDQTLGELGETVLEAKGIASAQIGVGSDATTRALQADVVNSILSGVFSSVNRSYAGLHLFGGSMVGQAPVQSFNGGYRYVGDRTGLYTDLPEGIDFPITLSADAAVGSLSARVEGTADLNAALTGQTFIRDLRGPAQNRSLGVLNITIDDGVLPQTIQVDLSQAETVGGVANAIESAIRAADPAALGGAYPAGVTLTPTQFSINGIGAGYEISFEDGPTDQTASALGLSGFAYDTANAVTTLPNTDLNPRVTDRTLLGDLGATPAVTFGNIVFRNGSRQGTVTTTPGMTVGEFAEAVRRLDLGVRVEVAGSGDRLNVVNEVAGFRMSIEEAGGTAATTLGIRSFSGETRLTEFNDGRGVQYADGATNPLTGLPDPSRNVDFRITLTDGSTFDVDLTQADVVSAQTVIDKINADAAAAGFGAVFTAALATNGNGIQLSDTTGGAGVMQVASLNGYAAEDLGLLDGTFTPGAPPILVGSDRASVRVDSLLTTLADLRDALLNNDERGITFAGERLEADLERLASARALVGGRASRVEAAQDRVEDAMLLDKSLKSDRQDLDLVEASSRFSQLQLQLQAGLTAVSQAAPLSLLNFLR